MPSDALTVAVTTGLGVSVLAGILSGICYILTHGIPKVSKPRTPITPWHCNVCSKKFRSIQGILESEKVVTCAKCGNKVCRVRCSKKYREIGWVCKDCQQPVNWFKGFLKSIHSSKEWGSTSMDQDAGDDLDDDLMELRKREREEVREFIEKLVETMLGDNLDNVSVSRIYNDKKYLPISGQSPCSAHTFLKQLIQRFTAEAVDLPNLNKNEDHPAHPEESLSSRTYEDLLSTAIINKVVESNQNDARSSMNSSRASGTTKRSENNEFFFGEETLEHKWRNQNNVPDDASSVSSLDDWIRSDSSVASSKYVDRVSLTIKQQIEEGSSSENESLDNDEPNTQDASLLQATDDSWQENWYFQKRRLTSSHSPVPVPMLVPNPITEAKVLIGDKEAEELSDIDSDYGDPEVAPDIKNILVNSKTIIGGKNAFSGADQVDATQIPAAKGGEIQEIVDKSTANQTERVSDTDSSLEASTKDLPSNELTPQINESKNIERENVVHVTELDTEGASLISIESNTEQDTEYTEQYASLTRAFLNNSAHLEESSPRNGAHQHTQNEPAPLQSCTASSQYNKNKDLQLTHASSDSDEERMKIFKGSYSEREKEKWKHSFVEIPHNPYSPENLERRLSSRSSTGSNSSIYGRDYYIKNAAKSAGARSPGKILNESETPKYSSTFYNNGNSTEVDTVTAIPAIVNIEENSDLSYIDNTGDPSPRHTFVHEISSDSDLSIERVYNLHSGEVVEKKTNIRNEVADENARSLEGLKYTAEEFSEDTKSPTIDENHNDVLAGSKDTFVKTLIENADDFSEVEKLISVDKNEQIIDRVPYNENTFKATLEKFKKDVSTGDNKTSNRPNVQAEISISDKYSPETNLDLIHSDSASTSEDFNSCEEAENIENKINTSDYSDEDIFSHNRDFSLEYSTDTYGDEVSRAETSLETDTEIIDLKQKGLVRDILGRFSRSYPNLSPIRIKNESHEGVSLETPEMQEIVNKPQEEIDSIPSVKNLKRLFDKNNHSPIKNDSPQIYSLTARSLPREIRQKLRSDNESLSQEDYTKEQTNNEEPVEELPADITKNMIAFYEHLRSNK